MALVDTTWYCNFGDGSTTGYYAVTKWATGATIAAGALRRQLAAPSVGNERVFVCIVAGTTHATTEPTWVLTRGAKTTDNTITWMEVTGQAALNGDLTNTATWAQVKAATPAVLGQIIKRSNNASYQICTTAGAMSASEPAFSDTAGVTTTDTTAVWTSLGVVGNFTGGQAPHARLANALAAGWFASGNTVYVGDNHAETQASSISLTANSALMARILCHNHSGSYPPAASDLTAGATITTTGTNTLGFDLRGSFYFYGLAFIGSTSGAGFAMVGIAPASVSQTQNWYYFDHCSLQIASTGASNFIQLGGSGSAVWSVFVFDSTTVKFAATTQFLFCQFCQFVWRNTGQILAAGSSVPATLFQVNSTGGDFNTVALEALDLSQLTGSLFSNTNASSIGSLTIKDCKLNAAATITQPINTGQAVQLSRSDSGATAYKSSRITYEGVESTETSIVRTGGYVDPTGQVQSRKIVTSANTQWLRPYKGQAMAVWNSTVGSSKTVTVYGTVNAGALPNNDDIWMEVQYLGDAGAAAVYATLDGTPVNATLSGGNLTATHSNTTTNSGARSTTSKTSGKFYFEATFNTAPSSGDCVGIMQVAAAFSDPVSSGVNCSCAYGSGQVYSNDAFLSFLALGAFASGGVLSVAVDLTAGLAWFRKNGGAWNVGLSGTPDPVTGVSGTTIETPSVGYVPFAGFITGGSGNNVTMNFGATAFAYAVPSGYTAGWGTSATGISPLGKIVTTSKAQVWSAGAAVSSDGSTWPAFYPSLDGLQTAVTMSNGNLTATHASGTGGARSASFLTGGKYYFESTIQVHLASVTNAVGIMVPNAVMIDPPTNCAQTNVGAGNCAILVNGVDSGKTLGAASVGDVFGVAVDLTARLIWFRRNAGNWNGDAAANPATGAGGVAIVLTGAMTPFVYFVSGATTDAFTVNFGATSYANAAPSGFVNWGTCTPFKLSTSITPQLPGYIVPVIKAAKAATTFYIDPAVVVT